MRPRFSLSNAVVVGTVTATLVGLSLTAASAQFDEGDYDLASECDLAATLKVRGNGNGLSVEGEGSLFVHTERDGGEVTSALVVDLGGDDPDDNTVVTVSSATTDGLTCATATDVSDADVAELIGLEDDEVLEDELSADDEDSAAEDSAGEDVDGEAAERVELCHLPEGANPHEVEVAEDAVAAHLEHGDLEGACPDDLVGARGTQQQRRAEAEAQREQARADREGERADRLADGPGRGPGGDGGDED